MEREISNLKVTKKISRSSFITGLGVVLGVGVVYWFDPKTSNLYPPCIFYCLTGWYCAGCGTGRAMHALLHLQFFQAFSYNPLLFVMVGYLGWDKLRSKLALSEKWYLLPQKYRPYRDWFIAGLVIVYWIIRNLPFFPFTYLAPH